MLALPRVVPTSDNNYVLLSDYEVEGVVVPKAYRTNGANIPRMFWILVPPFKPKYLPAVIVHDYLCDLEKYKKADDTFEKILFKIEKSWKTKMMVWTVRAYHKLKYKVRR